MQEDSREQQFEMDQEISIRELIDKILNRKWLITGMTAIFVLTAFIFNFFIFPPVYQSNATIMVNQGDGKIQTTNKTDNIEAVVDSLYSLPEMTINTYIRQIKSPNVLEATIKELYLEELGYNTGNLASIISATGIKDTNLIDIQVKNINPLLAMDIANEISRQTIIFVSENNRSQLSQSLNFLDEQIAQVRMELKDLRAQMSKIDQDARNVHYLSAERDSKTNDINELKSIYALTEIELNQAVRGKLSLEERIAGIPPGTAEYSQVNLDLVRKTTEVAGLEGKISALSDVIRRSESERIKLQEDYSAKNEEYETLNNRIQSLENTEEVLSEKRLQTQITQSVNLGETNLQLISRAILPENPISPKKALNVAISLVLGLMVSVFLVFLLDLMDNTIKTADDVQKHLGLPVLGAIPEYRNLDQNKGGRTDE